MVNCRWEAMRKLAGQAMAKGDRMLALGWEELASTRKWPVQAVVDGRLVWRWTGIGTSSLPSLECDLGITEDEADLVDQDFETLEQALFAAALDVGAICLRFRGEDESD